MLKACIGLNCARTIDYIDHRHCSLTFIPDDVYRNELTLEELLLDSNMLQELPAKFFRLSNLRKLTLSENDLVRLPPNIANLTKLLELDISKNAIEEVPQNMQFCRSLSILDLSSNPLLRTPDSVTSISSLTQLFLNDVSIPDIPSEIGNLSNLRILEARENMLKSLPQSIRSLKKLQRLDVGNNEIETLPEELGELVELVELWLDDNTISELPQALVKLSHLVVLDITKNKVERLPTGFAQLSSLADLHASENCIEELPGDFGKLTALRLVKLDYNHLRELPESIGGLELVTELLLYDNMLESLPASLFHMKSLEMLNVDRNHLSELPSSVGQCRSLHVLSMRENELAELPDELGQLEELTVLDVVGNRLTSLPMSVSNLHLDALWIDNTQAQPLVALHPIEAESDQAGSRKLTCVFLPQQGPYSLSLENFLEGSDTMSESQSVTSSLPREKETRRSSKSGRVGVAFDPSFGPSELEGSKLVRFPTPFRRDMNKKKKKLMKYKPDATPSTTIFKKGSSQDDLTLMSVSSSVHEASPETSSALKPNESSESVTFTMDFKDNQGHSSPGLAKMSGVENLASTEELNNGDREDPPTDDLKNAKYNYVTNMAGTDITGTSQLQTVEVEIELQKPPGKTLGFSIAGGRGSTPAYEDVDESIFVTKIAPGGLAELDGKLRLGDKLLKVNDMEMSTATHTEAVTELKNVEDVCKLVVSREVLVVTSEEKIEKEGEGEGEGEGEEEEEEAELPSGQATPKAAEEAEAEAEASAATLPTVHIKHTPPTEHTAAAHSNRTHSTPDEHSEGQNFAKRIVAEILDRSVTRLRDSVVLETKDEEEKMEAEEERGKEEEEDGGKTGPQHDNYINYDIAQSLLVGSRDAAKEEEGVEGREEREGSKTPTEEDSSHTTPSHRRDGSAAAAASFSLPPPPSSSSPTSALFGDTEEGEEEYEIEKVTLDRSVGKLGLSIIGGSEHTSRVFGGGRPGIYVSKISPGGAAEACGKLRLGDRILAVSGQSVRHSTHQQAVQWLLASRGDIELLVEHVPQPPGLQVITIKKSASAKLGISIKGGTKSTKGNPLDPNDNGIFISKITQGAAAEANRRLSVGQRILEVNGTSLLGSTHLVAVRALRTNPMEVSLLVCDGYDPREVVRKRAEQERASLNISIDTTSLSSEASRSLDDAVRILSESMDTLPVSPRLTVPLSSKLSRSSADIVDRDQPVTAEDLDEVLKGLAKFKDIESPIKLEPEFTNASFPDPPSSFVPPSNSSSFSMEIFPLQTGDLPLGLLGEDIPDISLPLVPPVNMSHKREERPTHNGQEEEEDEFANVQVEDTSSFLAQLDSDMSHLQDEVLKEEGKLEKEEEKAKEMQSRSRRRSSRGSSRTAATNPPSTDPSSTEHPPIPEGIMIMVEPPKDTSHQKEALDSMIGEVFDVSFDEFEEQSIPSGLGSGALTPSSEMFRSMSPDPHPPANMQELLSALQNISDEPQPAEVKLEATPTVKDNVSTTAGTEQKNSTQLKSQTLTHSASPVQLRVETGNKDPSRRKSAPPKVHEKPVRINPDKLTFQEKLALHQKTVEKQEMQVAPPLQHLARPSSAKRPTKNPVASEERMNQTSSAGEINKDTGSEEGTASVKSLSGRVAALQAFQDKSGVEVKVRAVQSEQSKMSAEERRLERILSKPTKLAAAAAAAAVPLPQHSDPSTSTDDSNRTATYSSVPPNQNGEVETKTNKNGSQSKREVKTTSITIPLSGPVSTSASTQPEGKGAPQSDQSSQDHLRSQSPPLPPAVSRLLADMPPPVQAPADWEVQHTGEETEKWEKRRAWREERREELEKEVERVKGLMNDISSDTSNAPPGSDATQ